MTGPGSGRGPVQPHRMRRNDNEWSPAAVITFDTATRAARVPGGTRYELAGWAARMDIRRPYAGRRVGTARAAGVTAAEFAARVTEWCDGCDSVWAFSHSLGADLTLLQVPVIMPRSGWTVTRKSVVTDSPWITFTAGRRRVTFADAKGYLRKELDDIAAAGALPRLPDPGQDAGTADLIARCERDADITAAAMIELMTWWDAHHAGNWALTGSALAWNHMRHVTPGDLPYIDHDGGGADRDREAVYGGMRGIASCGNYPGEHYVEMDFSRAYTVVPARLPVPWARTGTFGRLDPGHESVDSPDVGCIARCELSAAVPRWPAREHGAVFYPSGTFTTVLASPEIAAARGLGDLRGIGPGQFHQLSPWLETWAQACLDLSRGRHGTVPPAVQMWAKHAGRAVPGKFAQRGWRTLMEGTTDEKGFSIVPWKDLNTGQAGTETTIDGKWEVVTEDGNGENAYPAVLAFIESHVRDRLNRAMDAIGRGNVTAWDTDGLIVPARHARRFSRQDPVTRPLEMRRKGDIHGMRIAGPQAMWGPEYRKISGISRTAEIGEDGKFHGTLAPRMGAAGTDTSKGTYVMTDITYEIPRTAAMGYVLADGTVRPVELYIGKCGRNHARRPPAPGTAQDGSKLAPRQSAEFMALTDYLHPRHPVCEQEQEHPLDWMNVTVPCPALDSPPPAALPAAPPAGDGKARGGTTAAARRADDSRRAAARKAARRARRVRRQGKGRR